MRRRSRALAVWGGLAVTLLFAWLAVRNVDAERVWTALRGARWWWLIPSLAVLALSILLRAVRWRYLFAARTRPPFGAVASALLIGYLFNNLLPARAGEAARVVALAQRARASRAEAAGTVVIERAYDVLSLLVLLFVLVPWLPEVTWLRAAAVLAVVLAVLVAAAIAVLARFGERPVRFLVRPLGRLLGDERAQHGAGNLVHGLAGLRDLRLAAAAFALTTASWLVMGFSFWLAMPAFDLGLSPLAGVFVLIATGLAAILPASPGSLGVFEAAVVLALGAYGVPGSEALSYALVLHAVNLFPYLAVGLLVLQAHALRLRRRAE